MQGVNLAGGEFTGNKLPGVFHKDYFYPSAADIQKFADIGMNTIRVPFLWERLQPELNAPLSAPELSRLDGVMSAAGLQHMTVILDPHNYGSYRGKLIGSPEVPGKAFADFWSRIATHYKNEPFVVFGLMNEPNQQPAELWASIAQSAVTAIRDTGAKQLILVPGTGWSGAHSWNQKAGTLSNAEALAKLKDPAHNFAIEVHQYFDQDSSGTHAACVNAHVGEMALSGMTAWLRTTGNRGFLGEFGSTGDPVCLSALRNTLLHMKKNADVWQGWTYWGASAWFGNYMFNIMPPDPVQHKQVLVLEEFLPHTPYHH